MRNIELNQIKENIFNIIQFNISNSSCLDLFCGSGALGLECISRGANQVYFVDNNKENILALKKLLAKLNATNFYLLSCDFYEALREVSEKKLVFDIIFLDPPFDSNLAEVALQKIFKFGLLSQNGIVVWEHPTENNSTKFKTKIKDTRVYGKIQIDFLGY